MNSSDQIQAEQDAERLRDAAPDLLEALVMVYEHGGELTEKGWDQVRAAIQRATSGA